MAKVIDAVAVGLAGFSGKLYFFKGDRYLRVERSTGVVEANQPISAGWVLPSPFDHGIDAACNGHGEHEGKAFFFKGSQFLRYDWSGDKVDWAPQAISWWGVPAAFAAGIECALEGGPGYEGWVYFFKGDKYVRYSWSGKAAEVTKDESDKPLTLRTGWNLPDGFRNRVDAAVNDERSGNKDTYFYAGHEFLLYHWDNTVGSRVSFAHWDRPASWLLPAGLATATGTVIDANTAMVWTDKAPYAHNFKASDPKTRDWQAVWTFTPGSSATVLVMYFHGLHGFVTVANPSWAPTYIFNSPEKPPSGKLAPTVNGLYPVQAMDGILPTIWPSDSCTYNYATHLKVYDSLYYPVGGSAPKYRVDQVAANKGWLAVVPEVGDQSGNKDVATGFQLSPLISDVLAKLAAGTGILDPSGAAKTYAVPAASGIQKALITGHSAGGGVLRQLQGDPLFAASGGLVSGTAISVAIGVFDGMYGSWGTGYGALYKANGKLRLWLVNLSSAKATANGSNMVWDDFESAGILRRELDATGTALTKNPINTKTSATGLYLYTMTHTLGKNDGAVQAAMATASCGALFIQTDTHHDEIPNRFLPWMADAL